MHIPTHTDIQALVSSIFATNVQHGLPEELVNTLAAAFTTQSRTETDLFDFIAFAQACHEAADTMRKHGELDAAGFYFAMGQDLLTKAAEAYGALEAAYGQTQLRH